MTLRRALLLGALALGGVMAAEQPAAAFCRSTTCKGSGCARDENGCPSEGLPLFWPGSCVGFSFQQNLTGKLPPGTAKETVRRALFSWVQVPCEGGGAATITFSENEDTACNASGYDPGGPNVNVILFRDDDFPYRDEDNTLGKTTVTYDAKTGAILDADIEINAAFNELTVGNKRIVYDLESIMAHEVGHFLGVAHSPDPEATMYASYETGQTELRSLSSDDIAAACEIYPPSREAKCNPVPNGGQQVCIVEEDKGCSLGSPAGARGAAGGVVVLALAWLGQRRARSARNKRNPRCAG